MSVPIAANQFTNVTGRKKILKISFAPFANLQREIKKSPLTIYKNYAIIIIEKGKEMIPMKETFTNSFAEMSDADLDRMASAIRAEAYRRQNQKQEQMWNAVKDAIKNYINEFGEIEIESMSETTYLSAMDDYQTFGTIEQRGCY